MNITDNLNRRHLIQAVALAAAMVAGGAMAQACPDKRISLIALR